MARVAWVVAACLVALASASSRLEDAQPVVTRDMVDYINASGSWKASMDWVEGMTTGQARRMMGGKLRYTSQFPSFKLNALAQYLTVPETFTWEGNQCVGAIRNQGDCGSCWAFGAVEAFSDRVCLGTDATANVPLSPQWLVSCDTTNDGCGGGYLDLVWQYINENGIPAETSDPYASGENDESGKCPSSTANWAFYKSTTPTAYFGIDNIQAGLLTGPLETCFEVYKDFMSYTSGIYVHKTGDFLGGHCVKLLGWGNQNGTNYWIVANSWGTSWGQEGIFWIEFGQCGIDTEAMAADPVTSS